MSHSVLASFDPLAVHPFTNTSGLLPKPTPPSQYPRSLPSAGVSGVRPLLESPVELAGLPPRSCIAKGFAGGTTLCGDDTDTDEVEDDVLNGTRGRCGIRCACG